MRQSPMRLDRHHETVRQRSAPSGERRILWPPIETRVQLDGVENLDEAGQPAPRRKARRVEHIRPMVIGPSGCTDSYGQRRVNRPAAHWLAAQAISISPAGCPPLYISHLFGRQA